MSFRYLILYGLVLAPWITEILESGQLPRTWRGAATEIGLSLLIAVGVTVFYRYGLALAKKSTEIERLSRVDPLTGLGNSRSVQEVLVREIARTRRLERPLSCLLMDLDDFRMINDQHGHEKGNAVLQVTAGAIRGVIRHDVDHAFRYGGDEFLVILPEADGDKALAVAQRLRDAFIALQPPQIPKRALPVSIALSELQPDQRGNDVLRTLDRAMVKAKGQGKNMIYDAKLLG
jgi:diguanylate cyclase (GGDEF)-like protein